MAIIKFTRKGYTLILEDDAKKGDEIDIKDIIEKETTSLREQLNKKTNDLNITYYNRR